MYVNDKFYHKEWLDLYVFEEGFFESQVCEVAIDKEFKILLSEIYRVPNTSKNIFWISLHRKWGLLIHFIILL